ncbi:phosphate-responsive 1 family protein [Tripterygium wilfordii]|uniref:Phosphate-responsive 1 family protein n=1 Tax=Tripterygium wilfordii TaxID=458696 RepID=A0A7J7CML2_TRIWF|nr:phosphate-responsive 1 family protein [Tripterygium wilfordii]
MVESYQLATGQKGDAIAVKVVKTMADADCSAGKNLIANNASSIFEKAVGKDVDMVLVLFTVRDVAVQGLCSTTGKCSKHGIYGQHLISIIIFIYVVLFSHIHFKG